MVIPRHDWTPGLSEQPLTPYLRKVTKLPTFQPCAFELYPEGSVGRTMAIKHQCLLPPDDPVHRQRTRRRA